MRPEVTAFYGETSVKSSRSILSTPSFWLSFDWESITTVAFNGWIAVGETVVLLTSLPHPYLKNTYQRERGDAAE